MQYLPYVLSYLLIFCAREFVPCIIILELDVLLKSSSSIGRQLLFKNNSIVASAQNEYLVAWKTIPILVFRSEVPL